MNHYAALLGLRSVYQHRRRNLASACAIALGYIALLMVFGYGTRVSRFYELSTIYLQQSGHVSIFKKDGLRKRLVKPAKYALTAEDQRLIGAILSRDPSVDFSAGYLMGSGLVGNGCHSFLFSARAYDPKIEERIRDLPEVKAALSHTQLIVKGQALWSRAASHQVAVAQGLAKHLGKDILSDKAAQQSTALPDCSAPDIAAQLKRDLNVQMITRDYEHRIAAADADVTSIYATGVSLVDEKEMRMPLTLMQELLMTDSISYLAVYMKKTENLGAWAKRIEDELKAQGVAVEALVWNDSRLNAAYGNSMAALDVSLAFVSFIVLVVVFLSILNTLSIGLAESRREIGMLRAIGYRPLQIAGIFAAEACAVAAMALAGGALLTALIVKIIHMQNIPFRLPGLTEATTFQVIPTASAYVTCAAAIWVLVLATTGVMARRYARQEILNLLDRGA